MPATYRGPTGKEYQLTETDTLWLARMFIGEGGRSLSEDSAAAQAWCLMNRFMLVKGFVPGKLFWKLIESFSQALNPLWLDGIGDRCAPGSKYADTEHCLPERIERRRNLRAMAWPQVPAKIRSFAERFRDGKLPPPRSVLELERPRITNWGARCMNWATNPTTGERTCKTYLPSIYPYGVDVGGNWFFEENAMPGEVSVDGKGYSKFLGLAVGGVLGVLAIGVALAGVGYLLYSRMQ